jgi:hypothetical protein
MGSFSGGMGVGNRREVIKIAKNMLQNTILCILMHICNCKITYSKERISTKEVNSTAR